MDEVSATPQEVQSQAAALVRTTSQSRNLWGAYLSAFWENTLIEGKTIKHWLKHFAIVTSKERNSLTPLEINELMKVVLDRQQEAYYYFNKLRTGMDALELQLEREVEAKVRTKVDWYRDNPEDAQGRKIRTPSKDTLVTSAKAELADKFAALRRGRVEVSFFETIIRSLWAAAQSIQAVNTANAHEVRMSV